MYYKLTVAEVVDFLELPYGLFHLYLLHIPYICLYDMAGHTGQE
jgi:hypothetical protein